MIKLEPDFSDLLHVPLCIHKGKQYFLTISEFRETHYISIREYYMDEYEEWLPTPNGFSMPYTLESSSNLFSALVSLLSRAEVLTEVLKHVEFCSRTGQALPPRAPSPE